MEAMITESSGNVFVDLGFDAAEAAILQMRAELLSDLREYIKSHKMTKRQAARKLRIAEPRVSDLIHGKWEKFSLESLITLESRVGRKVSLRLAA